MRNGIRLVLTLALVGCGGANGTSMALTGASDDLGATGGVGGGGNGVSDMAIAADLAGDMAGRDMVSGADMTARSGDMAIAGDLAARADMTIAGDLAVRADMTVAGDLAGASDLPTPSDLATAGDLASSVDLAAYADLAIAPDFAVGADMTHAADMTLGGGAAGGGGTAGGGGNAGGGGTTSGGGGGGGTTSPPITSGHITTYALGGDFRDVSTDAADNIWAVTTQAVYYFANGATYTYSQAQGLARGLLTYTDDYYCIGSTPCPATNPVSFWTVSGGNAGQAFVGNIGYTGDRLDVDPTTGAVITVAGMQVTATQQGGAEELPEQQRREIATWKTVVDLQGPMDGRAYFGGFHGLSALSDMNEPMASGLCGVGCTQYEEHVHPFSADQTKVLGRDIRAIALTAAHDLWVGDADSLWFFPQLSAGANSDFFQNFGIPGKPGVDSLDVWPGVVDYIYGVGVDASGGLWVASYGNGLAYLAPGSYAPTYWTTANGLPQNNLTGLAIDGHGDVWIGTNSGGLARYTPSTQTWAYLTEANGLPSNDIRSVAIDRFAGGDTWIWFATDNGVAVYKP